jgi:hypothetical protein
MMLLYQFGNTAQWSHSGASKHCALPVQNGDCEYDYNYELHHTHWRYDSGKSTQQHWAEELTQVHADTAQWQFIMMTAGRLVMLSLKKWFREISVATSHSQLNVVHIDTSHWQFIVANMSRLDVWSLLSLRKIVQAYQFGNTEQLTHIDTVHW